MKSKKTNILLGIIAINLTLLTLVQLEVWPTKANANTNEFNSNLNYGLVPLNEDGSIDVMLTAAQIEIMATPVLQSINIQEIGGRETCWSEGDCGNMLHVSVD